MIATTDSPAVGRPQFPSHSPLRGELNRRVALYFERTGLDRKGGPRMWFKTAAILAWVVASYLLLLLWATTPWSAIPLGVSLGLALAGVGFAIMHDGGHGSYSSRRWVNRLSAGTLDLLGGSSYVWHHKHNVLHHSFTNVEGVDDDIAAEPFLRMDPSQRLLWFHRFQHWYMIPLLGLFFASKWTLVDDYRTLIRGKIGSQRIPRPRGWDLVQFFAGKLFFTGWALALPLALHPVLPVLGSFLLVAAVLGITLGVVFQLAHAVEGTAFEAAPPPNGRLERPFVEHQLATTADFAPRSRLLTWYVGGLNYQVEHHLFPRISHRHYPALAEVVREVCGEFGVAPIRHETFWAAFAAHVRFMRRMGLPPSELGAPRPAPPLPAAAA